MCCCLRVLSRDRKKSGRCQQPPSDILRYPDSSCFPTRNVVSISQHRSGRLLVSASTFYCRRITTWIFLPLCVLVSLSLVPFLKAQTTHFGSC